ncbi:MAG: site-specific DNA-methyltransferase [Candidatus Methanoperedens sp.]|nr:site-specific DNA-methyltransferase [Candidatus Methanoperedens sp.]
MKVVIMRCEIIQADCEQFLIQDPSEMFDLTFMDPPFNQGKEYQSHDDEMSESEYWGWMKRVCKLIYDYTSEGGAIYFMQREKNTQFVLEVLNSTGWTFQNLIVWRKKSSAVPSNYRFGKHYQIIAFATKGKKPRVFNKLRIDPPLLVTEKYNRPNGMFVTDVWDDIRELTSGYFAGDEPLRLNNGDRFHKQQSPVQLLTRIILSSSITGDNVFDPFAGTGTTLVAAKQLQRNSLGIEIDTDNVSIIKKRLYEVRYTDDILKYRESYLHTEMLDDIWPVYSINEIRTKIDEINRLEINTYNSKSIQTKLALLEKQKNYLIK